jgi:putative endonuclease
MDNYWVYILEVENGFFYTGYTTNLEQRYNQHLNGGRGSKYTRSFRPVRLLQCWKICGKRGDALKIENFIKKKSRKEKERLVKTPETLKDQVVEKLALYIDISPYKFRATDR